MSGATSLPLDPENRVTECIVVEVVLRVLAYATVGLRFWARRKGGTRYWWDDWLILAAAVYTLPFTILELVWLTHFGVARHLGWVLANEPDVMPVFLQIEYSESALYPPVISLIKLSILCLYVRLFGIQKKFAKVCYVQMGLVLVWAVVSEALYLFQCSPIAAAWSIDRTGSSCLNFTTLFAGTNAVNVAMDIGLLVTPLQPIWTLQLPRYKKILVSSVLILGASEIAFSTTRLIVLSLLSYTDVTWDITQALIWSNVENNTGIICACIPTLGPLLPGHWKERTQRGWQYGHGSGYASGYSSKLSRGLSSTDPESIELRSTTASEEAADNQQQWKVPTVVENGRIRQTTEFIVKTEPDPSLIGTKSNTARGML